MITLEGDNLARRSRDEWVLTNGLGGFAMGSASGLCERRYHAWLIAALTPPVGRFAALQCCAERVIVEDFLGRQHWDVSSHAFEGGVVSPDGASRLVAFEHGARTVWRYALAPGLTFERSLQLSRHNNSIAVEYRVMGLGPEQRASLQISPLVAMRDFHELLTRESRARDPHVSSLPGPDELFVRRFGVRLHIRVPGASFRLAPSWWEHFDYRRDAARGQDHTEDLYCPGCFEIAVPPSGSVVLAATVGEQIAAIDLRHDRDTETARLDGIASAIEARCAVSRPLALALACASDRFVVRRAAGQDRTFASVIAGYPWFSDWGRDTCISLPGLLLVTGRNREALECLRAFGDLRRGGLIPNCFDNGSGVPEYNTVDAPLWFLQACAAYLEASGDAIGFRAHLLPACRDIIAAYLRGTEFGIGVDPADGLVAAGGPGTQLTWMDARRDGVVFTPRDGKPVEINALWCSSLRRLADAQERIGGEPNIERSAWRRAADQCARSMTALMWNERQGCMADRLSLINGAWVASDEVRPNQLFAVSLPGGPVVGERARRLVATVGRSLLTNEGLRTLAPDAPGYRPRFEGTLFERDRAYHNGTVWPWLIGPFGEAWLRSEDSSDAAKREVRALIEPMLRGVQGDLASRSGTLLSVPEVYDADEPRRPDGCPMQAWSVAELIRLLALTSPTGA
ncbi:MAG: amylo-alpha-1,6-glucosidase [Phycisphaerales bacterium]